MADPLDDKIQEQIFPAYHGADSQGMAHFQDLRSSAYMMQDGTWQTWETYTFPLHLHSTNSKVK